ncbi:hypothetical protein, partial [Hallerella porci]|uniref:hypothetical protein n=1 Tax=Hallerella porci TaxID=1945871 RepID=UPI001E3D7A59
HILENLAIFSQGRNQFFPIVMRAGRDFKGRLYNNGLGNDIITVESSIQVKSDDEWHKMVNYEFENRYFPNSSRQ